MTPSGQMLYRLATQQHKPSNACSKFCPGCKRARSIRQFKAPEDLYCQRCVTRGIPEEA